MQAVLGPTARSLVLQGGKEQVDVAGKIFHQIFLHCIFLLLLNNFTVHAKAACHSLVAKFSVFIHAAQHFSELTQYKSTTMLILKKKEEHCELVNELSLSYFIPYVTVSTFYCFYHKCKVFLDLFVISLKLHIQYCVKVSSPPLFLDNLFPSSQTFL